MSEFIKSRSLFSEYFICTAFLNGGAMYEAIFEDFSPYRDESGEPAP